MKRKTLVCQFASPLDVDVHNTPQAILLEGKYWKRKCNVIKAEYKKWRRFYVNKALGANNIVDTTSELDFFEWSPHSSEPLFMIADSMSTDTLLSTLSKYPFPDSREIARGAGRSDFIQPSLGPLQPNFEDLMDLDLDFLNFPRLAPVPEEGSEDILKAIDYNYPGGFNQMNSGSNIQEINDSTESTTQQTSSQLISARTGNSSNSVITGPGTSLSINQQQQQQQQQSSLAPSTIQYSAKIFAQSLADTSSASSSATVTSAQQQQQQLSNVIGSYLSAQLGQQPAIVTANVPIASDNSENTASSDEVNKDSKPRFSRSFPRILGREPHNYDKCPPTTHQTMAYNLVSQPHLNQNILNNSYQSSAYHIQPSGIIQMSGTPPNQNLLNYNLQPQTTSSTGNPMNLTNSAVSGGSNPNLLMQSMSSKLLTHSQSLPVHNQGTNQKPQPRSISMPTAQNYPPMMQSQNSPQGALLQQHHQDAFKGSFHTQTSSYKSYHSHQPQPYKIPSQNTLPYGNTGRSMRHSSPPHGHQQQNVGSNQQPSIEQSQQQLQDLQLQQQHQSSSQSQHKRLPPHPTKEMFRSNSLPINATFPLPPKEVENFAVPRYQAKPNPKLRTRSNSMVMKQLGNSSSLAVAIGGASMNPGLHAASSEPVLNMGNSALLAQLLTTNNTSTLFNVKQQTTTSSAISNLQTSQQQSHQQIAQQQQQQQQHSHYQQPPLGSPISPTSSQLQLNQSQPNAQLQQPRSNTPAQSSVLSFASSASYSGISIPLQSLSPDSMLDSDTPMSPVGNASGLGESSGGGCGSSSGGVGNKFHQQQQGRSDSQRRTGHIHAEQKRRYNIKNGFDMLHSLIPQLQQNPNAKLSKAAMLQKGAEYIKQLRSERSATNEKMDALRREIDALNNSLSNLQTALPASGAPVSRQRTGRVKELYQQYVRQRTLDNWKFWIFGLIFEPLMTSFNQTVSVASLDEMCRSCGLWVDQHCSLVELRPAVSNKLRQLSTTTDILSDPPTSLQEEVMKAISTSLPLPSSSSGPTASCSSHGGSSANSPNPTSSGF
ncbi:MLX-interacting protein isoform X3 [Ochlerotatus camptorhynchus]